MIEAFHLNTEIIDTFRRMENIKYPVPSETKIRQ